MCFPAGMAPADHIPAAFCVQAEHPARRNARCPVQRQILCAEDYIQLCIGGCGAGDQQFQIAADCPVKPQPFARIEQYTPIVSGAEIPFFTVAGGMKLKILF